MRLVQRQASRETIDVLTALLAEARAGEIVGVAYVALHHGSYSADTVGAATTSRANTILGLRLLEQKILTDS